MCLRFAVLCSLLAAVPARAHDHWLEWSDRPNRQLNIQLFVGEHLTEAEHVKVRTRAQFSRVGLQTPGGEATDLLSRVKENAPPLLVLDRPATGGRVWLESIPKDITLPAAKFEAYLTEEHLEGILALRKQRGTTARPGVERYVRSLQVLLPGTPPEAFAGLLNGQALEIVPLSLPTRAGPGAQARFRILGRGEPVAGQAVAAAFRKGKTVTRQTLRTAADGEVVVPIETAGDWLIRLVQMRPATTSGVDWESNWASLFFRIDS